MLHREVVENRIGIEGQSYFNDFLTKAYPQAFVVNVIKHDC